MLAQLGHTQGFLFRPLLKQSNFCMYKYSRAFNTKGSGFLTCSRTSPARWEILWPGLLKWNPLGSSSNSLLTYCLCSPKVFWTFWWLVQCIHTLDNHYICFLYISSNKCNFRSHKSLDLGWYEHTQSLGWSLWWWVEVWRNSKLCSLSHIFSSLRRFMAFSAQCFSSSHRI